MECKSRYCGNSNGSLINNSKTKFMTSTEKREIQFKLRIYISSFSSQSKACKSLDGAREATVIAMLGKNESMWETISEAMWRNVAAQVGGVVNYSKLVETLNFHTLTMYFDLAKDEGASFALIGNAGWGKSYCAKWYSAINRKNNVYYVECGDFFNKKMFLNKLLMQMGVGTYGMAVGDMMENLIREIRKQDHPLIILDEIDKLPDVVLKFFITMYNELNKHCGFVWLSTDAIKKRMTKGIEKSIIGYQEIFSRIGAQFINLLQPSRDEVAEICKNNGMTDPEKIAVACNEVADLRGDLRRVDRNILKDKMKKNRNKKAA
jgi:Cdc6-like AAA superfamily ATPase